MNISLEEWHLLSAEEKAALLREHESSDEVVLNELRTEYWMLKNDLPSSFGTLCEQLISSGREYTVKRLFEEPTEAICLLNDVASDMWKPQFNDGGNETGILSGSKAAVLDKAMELRPDLFKFLGDKPRKDAKAKLWQQAGLDGILRQARGYEKNGP